MPSAPDPRESTFRIAPKYGASSASATKLPLCRGMKSRYSKYGFRRASVTMRARQWAICSSVVIPTFMTACWSGPAMSGCDFDRIGDARYSSKLRWKRLPW